MDDSSVKGSKIDPELREKLLKESRNPWRGLRRGLWIACFGSASIGFLIMSTKAIAGGRVLLTDASIQFGALMLFGALLWFDRLKEK